MKNISFRIVAYTDSAGKSNPEAPRNGNEDNMYVKADLSSTGSDYLFNAGKEEQLSEKGCLMVVADGMGGMNAGEVASEIAIQVVSRAFGNSTFSGKDALNASFREKFLESVIVDADTEIKKHAKTHPECEGMGSTAILVWVCGNEATVSWCGDSRAYLFRDCDGLRQISKDHSYVQELVDAGKITMDEAFDHPFNNVITRSLGDSNQKARPESVTIPLLKGDVILVNSDGLSGVLRDHEMEKIIRENRADIGECRQALWAAAEAAGWYDNVTAILCEITDSETDQTSAGTKESDIKNDSFLHFRISKKALRWACLAVLVISALVAAIAIFLRKPNMEAEEEIVEENVETESLEPGFDLNERETQNENAQRSKVIQLIKETLKKDEVKEDNAAQEENQDSAKQEVDSSSKRLTPVKDEQTEETDSIPAPKDSTL